MKIRLSELLKSAGALDVRNFTDSDISEIVNDTRKVVPGCLFIAMSGGSFDSHDHLAQAVAAGASALVIEKDANITGISVPVINVSSSFEFTKRVASVFYDNPSRKMTMVGITGTNGKTTTSFLVRSVLSQKYGDCGLIGTIKYVIGADECEAPNTSPEPLFFQGLLARMVDRSLKSCVMEVSSHAIKLGRIDNTEYDYLIFTNLSQEHTEFHPDMQDYYLTKASLFINTLRAARKFKTRKKYAIINIDDDYGKNLAADLSGISPSNVFTISQDMRTKADMVATDIVVKPGGVSFYMGHGCGGARIELPITGAFNVYNAMAAAACGICDGLSLSEIKQGLESVAVVPGRFQKVDYPAAYSVIVDYAHTPEGVRNVLGLARQLGPARVITVFGCGGDRSREKRPEMGRYASCGSDHTIITSDNPRTENPAAIIADILPGVVSGGGSYEIEPERRKAIEKAIFMAKPGDLVMIVGKGHENYQIVGRTKQPFDDCATALEFMKIKESRSFNDSRKAE